MNSWAWIIVSFYAASIGIVYIVALQSRSPQIAAAARLICINWILSLQIWLVLNEALAIFLYALIDVTTAAIFYLMARKAFFPVPLCILHASLGAYHLYTAYLGEGGYWMQLVLNRTLDIELMYVFACAVFRIVMLKRAA